MPATLSRRELARDCENAAAGLASANGFGAVVPANDAAAEGVANGGYDELGSDCDGGGDLVDDGSPLVDSGQRAG